MYMWNYNIKQGAIWSVKSLNEYDYSYKGMSFGENYIMILSSYIDDKGLNKITYLRVDRSNTNYFSAYTEVNINNRIYYVNLDDILTGDVRCLDRFIKHCTELELREIQICLKAHFSFLNYKKHRTITNNKCIPHTTNTTQNIHVNKNSIQIHKFGMDIIIIPNEHVNITKSNRLNLSAKVKSDILSGIDSNIISETYGIYPEQAVRIIRSKLVYQYKNR